MLIKQHLHKDEEIQGDSQARCNVQCAVTQPKLKAH